MMWLYGVVVSVFLRVLEVESTLCLALLVASMGACCFDRCTSGEKSCKPQAAPSRGSTQWDRPYLQLKASNSLSAAHAVSGDCCLNFSMLSRSPRIKRDSMLKSRQHAFARIRTHSRQIGRVKPWLQTQVGHQGQSGAAFPSRCWRSSASSRQLPFSDSQEIRPCFNLS